LGRASDEERTVLEDEYFEDEELFEQLQEMDDALLDSYLDGAMTPADRTAFERTLETYPRRKERLLLARALALEASKAAVAAPPVTEASRLQPLLPKQTNATTWYWKAAFAAAALILVTFGTWSALEVARLRQDLQQAVQTQAAVQRDAAATRAELDRERERADRLAASARPSPTGTEAGRGNTPLSGIIALTLTPGLLREGTLPRVTVAGNALLARLDVRLSSAQFTQYRAVLRTAAGEERWSQTGVSTTGTGSPPALRIDIPVTALTDGQFVLDVRGIRDGRETDSIDEYHFTVTGRRAQ
jgi:hypothetical protein